MKNFIFAAAVAVVALASCQKETTVRNELSPMNEIALRSVNGTVKSAINGTTFPAGYDILVSAYRNLDSAVKGNDNPGNFFEAIHFSKGASDAIWHSSTPKYWPLTGNLDLLCIASSGIKSAANGIVPTCTWGESGNVAKKAVVSVPDNSIMFDDLLFGAANAQTYVSTGTAVAFNHAETAVVFTAKSNVKYNESSNVGITIDSISINGAKYSGTLTVSNPAAGSSTGSISAAWSDLGTEKPYVKARVWNIANLGNDVSEPALTGLHLADTSANLSYHPFGEAYVILPEQDAVPFTVTYTIHNGFKADGNTKLDNQLQYKYTPAAGTKWAQGKKNVYDLNISLNEITIAPTVVDWSVSGPTSVDIKKVVSQ